MKDAASAKTGGSVNTSSSTRSRIRAKGSKKSATPSSGLKWGKNKTKTFVTGDEETSDIEDVTPGGTSGSKTNPTPAEASGALKRSKKTLAGASSKTTIARQEYTHSAFMVMTIEIGAGIDKADVASAWEDVAIAAIEKCHGFDAACCYIQPDDEKGKRIYSKADKPDNFSGWDDYMAWDNRDLLSLNAPRDRRRKIVSHCLMGMSKDPTEFISKHNVDISRVKVGDSRISMEMKHFQAWKTSRRLIMVNGPTKCLMDEYEKYGTKILCDLRKELVRTNPRDYPLSVFGEDPKLMVVLDWGKGGNWNDPSKRVAGENTANRKVPTFTYEQKHEKMILILAKISKERKLEHEYFGQSAHWQELPATKPSQTPQTKKNALDLMYIYHGGAQKSLGSTVLEGLIRPDYKVPVDLENDPETDDPRPSPGEYSVKDLLTRIYIGPIRLFQSVLMGDDGHYLAFFSSINELAKSMADDIGRDVG